MDNVLIISQKVSEYFKNYLKIKFNKNVITIELYDFPDSEFDSIPGLISTYHKICNLIEEVPYEVLRECIAIVDLPFPHNSKVSINPIQKFGNLNQLAGMLLLTYPEIHWYFIFHFEIEENNNVFKNCFLYYSDLFDEDKIKGCLEKPSPLFDGYCIRKEMRKILKEKAEKSANLDYLILRELKAVSIDEEIDYAYLNSYIAYKAGFRSFPIYTLKDMEIVLGNEKDSINLIFEDMFLNFPDKTGSLSDLEDRDKKFPKLKLGNNNSEKRRIFLTIGHKYYKNKDKNEKYIKNLKNTGLKIKNVYKPTGGIFNILEESGVIRDYKKFKNEEFRQAKPKIEEDKVASHSAPGILLLISEKLILRAKKLFNGGNKVEDFIHGSLLALEAQELLGYKTPTTCLEAIALKHKNEVKAECMFYGVSYNIDLKNRFKEIDKEIEAVSKWFRKSVKKNAFLNAQMQIITELIKIFREFGQYDEEMECIKRFNKLNRRFFFSRKPYLVPFWPIKAYIERLLTSLTRFLISIIIIPFATGVIKYSLDKGNEFWQYILQAYMTFFSFQPIDKYFESTSPITLFLIVAGYIHLGIFISYLYSMLMRK